MEYQSPIEVIWQGTIEWAEKSNTDGSKIVRHLPVHIIANNSDGDIEINADAWPSNLRMQVMPKQIISLIGTDYLKNSKYIFIDSEDTETLDGLTAMLNMGFAGCVQLPGAATNDDVRILILLYAPTRKVFLGLVPNDQSDYIRRLREALVQVKEDYRRYCHEEEPDR